jgi:GNAT superfamily N-acetyltransferase
MEIVEIPADHPARDSAERMAYHSFLHKFRSAHQNRTCGKAFFPSLHDELEEHLKRGRLLVAPLPGFDDEWAGWALGGNHALIWVFVKQPWRGQGVSVDLLRGLLSPGDAWYPYHGDGAEDYLVALEPKLNVRFRHNPRVRVR